MARPCVSGEGAKPIHRPEFGRCVMIPLPVADSHSPLVRVMALHALAYCERLFYLEEVEEIRIADERVYAGRTLHEQEVDLDGEWQSVTLESERWGLRGKADYVRHRDGSVVVFEHKKGRAPRS